MKLTNIWLLKAKEKVLLKIVEWAQKNNRKLKSLTKQEVLDAVRLLR